MTKNSSEPEKNLLNRLPSLSRILSVAMLLLGILAVGALFYRVMAGFFVPLFLAALLVVIFRPVNDFIFNKIGKRRHLSAAATTFIILLLVLLPVIAVISVATTQFTAMVSHMNLDDLTSALDRARDQLGISLNHAEKFRRLDSLVESMDEPSEDQIDLSTVDRDATLAEILHSLDSVSRGKQHQEIVIQRIDEAVELINFLQLEVDGPPSADAAAEKAIVRLAELKELATMPGENSEGEWIGQMSASDQFHRYSVVATAAVRTWMRTLLGGTFRSQVRLIANPSAEDFKSLLARGRETLQPRFVSLTSATGTYLLQGIIGLIVLVIAVYFFLIDGAAMVRTLMRLSPLDDNYERRLLMEFDKTSRAVVLASVLSAVVQGLLAGFAYYFLGFESVVLLFLATTLMALVPFLGAASVWVPCVIWLLMVEQRIGAAVFLAIYGALVVSSIDNVIKAYVLHGHSQLHPLFALLSVLGGVKVFGPIGILVGPMVVVFMQTLLEILNHELATPSVSEKNIQGPRITKSEN